MRFQPAAWVVLIGCSLGGAIWSLRIELRRAYYTRHDHWREAPLSFIASCGSATLLGVGVGMGVAVLMLAAAALIVRVQ